MGGGKLILLWGVCGDDPISAVRHSLLKQDESVFFLDQQQSMNSEIELSIDGDVKGTLRTGSEIVDLDTITSAYLRPYDPLRIKAIEEKDDNDFLFDHMLDFEDSILCWMELTQALVVNRPSSMASNNSKPYQSALIKTHGFDVPDTLITTDVYAVLEFWEKHEKIIYKSLSGIRSIVSQLKPEHKNRLRRILTCPTQFQEYIEGTDYRVHVVGDEIFACKIISKADDYRYGGRQGYDIVVESCTLEQDISEHCLTLAHSLQLPLAGIDLRCTPKGKWYCFEVNPSPGFTFYQIAANQYISDAIARLLMRKNYNSFYR